MPSIRPCRASLMLAVFCAAQASFTSVGRAADALDLTHVPESAVAAVVLHPAELLARKELELLPTEVIAVAGKKELGLDPLRIERVIGLVSGLTPNSPPDYGVILYLSDAHELDSVLPALRDQTEQAETESGGAKFAYRKAASPQFPSYAIVDGKTLLVGSEQFLLSMLAASGGDSPLRTRLAKADVSADLTVVAAIEPLRELIKQGLSQIGDPPPALAGLMNAPDQVDFAEFRLSLKEKFRAELSLRATDADAAAALQKALGQALEFAREQVLAEMNRGPAPTDPVEKAMQAYGKRITNTWMEDLSPSREGDVLTIDVESNLSASTLAVGAGLLMPAVQKVREAAARTASMNNMHQMLIAMHNYEAVNTRFPPRAITSAEGKPLLSWRVALLPYLEGDGLYSQFHLDETWDSEHNLRLLDQMPMVYQNPSWSLEPGKTNYLAPVAKGTAFGEDKGIGFAQFHDGTSNTIVLLEADPNKAVPWTKPEDLEVDPDNAKGGLGNAPPRTVIMAGFGDGSVQSLKLDISPATLWKLFTHAGGETVGYDEYAY